MAITCCLADVESAYRRIWWGAEGVDSMHILGTKKPNPVSAKMGQKSR